MDPQGGSSSKSAPPSAQSGSSSNSAPQIGSNPKSARGAAAKAPPPTPKAKAKPQISDERRETLKRVFEGITKMEDLVVLWETMTGEERVIFADMKDITKERLK